ncbi:U-box domain-containing protein 43 [Camellia lanceoleosa]|uniref:U-box domain-containing protein 43 n=1 Tax=Camellia lanceoleosa TaxID=1840588 RepID=A0ACC0H003_9ERIC|nr:U-box domain-containing protein 43 [Camellia lanceoleosa]
MANNVITSASLVLASEILSETILAISEAMNATKSVLIQKENFNKFSTYLERIAFVLRELFKSDIKTSVSLKNAVEILNGEIKVAKQLALNCGNRNKVYLLFNCRRIVKHLESSTKEISQALGLISLACLDDPSSVINDEVSMLCKNMLETEYHLTVAEEEILEKIELGIEERNVDQSYANDLIIRIAEAVGISTQQAELKREFEELKSEMDNNELREDVVSALQMERIIALLSKADMITTYKEKEIKYLTKRSSLGRQELEPLQSFYCPITGDIMVDPVETSYGHTFERSAIQKWLADCNLCPITKSPLNASLLRTNKTLQKSIEEWKDRNTMITIASMKVKIQSDKEQEVLHSLSMLQDLCVERELHKEWMIMEDYVPILVGLLGVKNFEIRKHALDILCTLAKDNEDNKDRIAKVDNAVEFIVRSLARKVEESKLALQLLLELSRNGIVRNLIGRVQGSILLLVTMSSSDDTQAAKDAHELLENLSFDDQNVVQMAKANYFGPLLHFLSSGTESVQMMMAKTLSEVELTDHSKLSLFKDGAQGPLMQLLSHGDIEMKKVAVKSLQNLSSIPQNGQQMIREGAVGPLFELLYCHRLSSSSFRKQVAATIAHLAISNTSPEEDEMQVSIFESEEDVFKLFSLVSLTGLDVQESILQIFIVTCQSSSGFEIRTALRQISATRVLVQLCELDDCAVRANAVKLFCCLTQDGDEKTFLEHVGLKCIETLFKIAKTSNKVDEIASAMGIVSNLPKNPQMNEWLLDANALQVIFTCLVNGDTDTSSYKREVVENAAKALCRFTLPTNQEWQRKVAEAGFIPVLVQLLVSGTVFTKQNVAISLKQFSESSSSLSREAKKQVVFFGCCFASPEIVCPVHGGICTLESSFCLLEADAVKPLVRVLEEQNSACEASLDALLTLIEGEQLQRGSKVLVEANAIVPMIKLLSSLTPTLQEKALKALERMFRLVELKQKYGGSAELPLVDITQRGTSSMKSLAAKTLAHLNVLHDQSSFF